MAHADKVLAAALDLPEDERARVAHELIRSLDADSSHAEDSEDAVQAAWTGELARRLQEVGTAELVDLDEVDAEVDAYVTERLAAGRR